MKLATYVRSDDASRAEAIGVLRGKDEVVSLQDASLSHRGQTNPHFDDMIAFLRGGAEARAEAEALVAAASANCVLPLSAVRLLAPVPRPRMMRDTACYEGHLVNGLKSAARLNGKNPDEMPPEAFKLPDIWYELPLFYKVNVNSIMGMDDEVAYPEGERFKDYELELAVIIGKEGRNINARDAMDHVGGYTIYNDCSARMTQGKEMPNEFHVGPGLGKDFANPMGPCMVTSDAFNPDNAETVTRVNGVEQSRSNTGEAYHRIEDVISYISSNTTLYPGDVIAMGTVPMGSGLELLRPLKIGDVIELEVEGIGVLRNKVVAPEVAKVRNKDKLYKRYVCATVDGKSDFVIDDYPDITKSKFTDVWRITEMPAADSATGNVDKGNEAWEHEAPQNGSSLRFIQLNPDVKALPKLADLPPQGRQMYVDIIQDMHREIGTHYIPQEADLEKNLTLHKTDSINLFVCLEGLVTSINDEDEIELQPGDAFIQLGSMHAWDYRGEPPCFLGGMLVDSDPSTFVQLDELPEPQLKSSIGKFKRYVSGTVTSADKAIGKSRVLIDDFAPNEAELRDAEGNHIGWAGDIWNTYAGRADCSGRADTVTGPMQEGPPKSGITFRMVELLPNSRLNTNPNVVNYYTVIAGELTAVTDQKSITAGRTEHVVQLKARMEICNNGDGPLRFAHFMVDATA